MKNRRKEDEEYAEKLITKSYNEQKEGRKSKKCKYEKCQISKQVRCKNVICDYFLNLCISEYASKFKLYDSIRCRYFFLYGLVYLYQVHIYRFSFETQKLQVQRCLCMYLSALPAIILHKTPFLHSLYYPTSSTIQAVFGVFAILFLFYFFAFIPIVVDHLLYLIFFIYSIYCLSFLRELYIYCF